MPLTDESLTTFSDFLQLQKYFWLAFLGSWPMRPLYMVFILGKQTI